MHAEQFVLCLKEQKPAGIEFNYKYIVCFLYNFTKLQDFFLFLSPEILK